ncbi:MAG: hypothetical protein M1330_05305 [Armatimonadetes bacterium]|nr:hypothetical protein [Armatimonadota bacterium]
MALSYTSEILIEEAKREGFIVSERLITDWVELGLLDRPGKRGLGRGRGSIAVWPENQRHLFINLLDKRREVNRIGPLCNIPVWLWLYWGDAYVPLRQVRRALRTWGESQGVPRKGVSWKQGRKAGGNLVKQISHPDAKVKDRKALQEAVVGMLSRGEFDRERLLPLVRRVFDPHNTGKDRGPAGAPFSPDGIVTMIEARHKALLQLDELNDSLFEWARFTHLIGLQEYQSERPQLAADPDLGKLFHQFDLNEIANRSCYDLVTFLGIALIMPATGPVGSLENPETWKQNNLHLNINRVDISVGTKQSHIITEGGVILPHQR